MYSTIESSPLLSLVKSDVSRKESSQSKIALFPVKDIKTQDIDKIIGEIKTNLFTIMASNKRQPAITRQNYFSKLERLHVVLVELQQTLFYLKDKKHISLSSFEKTIKITAELSLAVIFLKRHYQMCQDQGGNNASND